MSPGNADIVVVGAGHAGCEAALAGARMGLSVLVVTTNLDRVGFLPCNPSIGGPGKSQLVAEVDALGGVMAEIADAAALQIRMLNTSKGPAVQALRGQMDKQLYSQLMRERLEAEPRIGLFQDEVIALRVSHERFAGVCLRSGGHVPARAVIVSAGTFLRAQMIGGESRSAGGRAGDAASGAITESLQEAGIRTRRFKTGTPPRIQATSVDLDRLEQQLGDDEEQWFSDEGQRGRIVPVAWPPSPLWSQYVQRRGEQLQLPCFRLSTNQSMHQLIGENLHRAPMYNGAIEGIGPRYCPSIEDKIARFGDKDAHPIFLEPEGWRSGELYVQGMSTSLPYDVQLAALRTIKGLERAVITRPGYAVEYDALDMHALQPTLESTCVRGLFFAGQVNGTSGYEEAAGQGIVAGINAAASVLDIEPLVLGRDEAYIGVMIDDLVSKPLLEPYRMLTARAEYRLTLRSSTVDERLLPVVERYGLMSSQRRSERAADVATVLGMLVRLNDINLTPSSSLSAALNEQGQAPLSKPMTARELGRRPDLALDDLVGMLPEPDQRAFAALPEYLRRDIGEALRYGGFLRREQRQVERFRALTSRRLDVADFGAVRGLRVEARQQLEQHRPATFGAATSLPGVTPADIAALLIHSQRVGVTS